MKKPGEESFKLDYHPLVVRGDIPSLDPPVARRIRLAIENRLIIEPTKYGEPLHGPLWPYWKLRVGDWRVLYTIEGRRVQIILIGHRREVYHRVLSRLNLDERNSKRLPRKNCPI